MTTTKQIEEIASVQHDIWAHWMKYQFSVCQQNDNGSLTISADKVQRWTRQIDTPYSELTDREKKSDIEQVMKFSHLL